jgi:DNA-binding transcriptional regulator YbjK
MTHWRQKARRKTPKRAADVLRERSERRTAALIACITEVSSSEGPEGVTHGLVAERAGVPVQYVEWKYPSREHLMAVANT